jgi:RNA polymerase sigma-70 factor (ECF subfamily)
MDAMSASDHELMRRLAAGDERALEQLIERWQRGVGRLLRRLAPDEADDLRQEAFVRVLTAAPRYRPQGEFSTWLYRIVLNLARDAARRRSRRPLPLEADPIAPGEGNGAPPRQCARRELAAKVERALDTLPPDLRDVLVLKHYGELSLAEVADVLSLPASTVKSRAAVALKKLAVRLKQDGIDETELEP